MVWSIVHKMGAFIFDSHLVEDQSLNCLENEFQGLLGFVWIGPTSWPLKSPEGIQTKNGH